MVKMCSSKKKYPVKQILNFNITVDFSLQRKVRRKAKRQRRRGKIVRKQRQKIKINQ
jgi:hypothetical protein